VHFLVIDDRFRVPVFVFLELDPRLPAAGLGRAVHGVTLELAEAPAGRAPQPGGTGVRAQAAIGGDPDRPDRFVEFPSEGHVRAAGFTLIEPRYVGPSWETYVSVFRPEGERRPKVPVAHPPPRPRPARTAARPERI
jgi:hypothetical protein